MSELHKRFNQNVQIGNTFTNQNLYESLSSTFKMWSGHLMKQSLDVQEQLTDNFTYSGKEFESLQDVKIYKGKIYHFLAFGFEVEIWDLLLYAVEGFGIEEEEIVQRWN